MDESLRFTEKMGIPADVATAIRSQTRIVIKASSQAQRNYGGQVMLETSANLLGRIFPHVVLEVESWPADKLNTEEALDKHLEKIIADAWEWNIPADIVHNYELVIGDVESRENATYIDADGWLAYVGTRPSGWTSNMDVNVPIGPVVSACLGVAEVFKKVFQGHIKGEATSIDGTVCLNTLTYSENTNVNSAVNDVIFDRIVLFGCGSVGSSLLYTLKFMPNISGGLDIVDKDAKVDFGNLQRYSFLTLSDLEKYKGVTKARWAADKFKRHFPGLQITPWDEEKGEVITYLNANPVKPGINVAISAVDKEKARIQIADCLARRTINAGTGNTTLSVTRHGFADGRACLACNYIGKLPNVNWYHELHGKTGLPVERISFLWEGNDLINAPDVKTMQEHGFITEQQATELVGTDFRSLINRRLYAQVQVSHNKDEKPVTAPFVSTMAGALLAGELIKELSGLSGHWEENKYKANLLLEPTTHAMWVPYEGEGNCLCKNSFRISKYKELWS